jgi:hypothetical protein
MAGQSLGITDDGPRHSAFRRSSALSANCSPERPTLPVVPVPAAHVLSVVAVASVNLEHLGRGGHHRRYRHGHGRRSERENNPRCKHCSAHDGLLPGCVLVGYTERPLSTTASTTQATTRRDRGDARDRAIGSEMDASQPSRKQSPCVDGGRERCAGRFARHAPRSPGNCIRKGINSLYPS